MSDKAVLLKDVIKWLRDYAFIEELADANDNSQQAVELEIESELPTFTSLKPLDKETVEGMQKDVYQAMAAKSEYTMRECRMYNKALDDVLKVCGKPTLERSDCHLDRNKTRGANQ